MTHPSRRYLLAPLLLVLMACTPSPSPTVASSEPSATSTPTASATPTESPAVTRPNTDAGGIKDGWVEAAYLDETTSRVEGPVRGVFGVHVICEGAGTITVGLHAEGAPLPPDGSLPTDVGSFEVVCPTEPGGTSASFALADDTPLVVSPVVRAPDGVGHYEIRIGTPPAG